MSKKQIEYKVGKSSWMLLWILSFPARLIILLLMTLIFTFNPEAWAELVEWMDEPCKSCERRLIL